MRVREDVDLNKKKRKNFFVLSNVISTIFFKVMRSVKTHRGG